LKDDGRIAGIDVVILGYNEQASVEEAIADVHRALGPLGIGYHVVFVDDGSTDDTLRIACRIAARDPRVTVRSHVHNRGMGAATRTGFEASTLPYVTMLPADRQIRAEVLPALIEKAGPRAVVTSLYTNRPNDMLRTISSRTFRLLLRALLGPTPPLEGTYVAPRSLVEEADLSSDSFVVAFELLHRAVERGYEIRVARIPSHAREHGASKVFGPRRIARAVTEVARLRRRLGH